MDRAARLPLDRSLGSPKFESWRLAFTLVDLPAAQRVVLPAKVARTAGSTTDYIRTRLAALHNNLHCSNGELYLFLDHGDAGSVLQHVFLHSGSIGLSPLPVLPLPDAALNELGGLLHAPLSCSCCEVSQLKHEAATPAQLMALSSGRGDLTLAMNGGEGWRLSNPVFPVTPGAPRLGVEPFVIMAAVRTSSDAITVAVVTVLDKTERCEAGCEVRVFQLHFSEESGSVSVASEAAVLYVSSLPPFAVVMGIDAHGDASLLMAAAPGHPKQEGHAGAHPDHRGLGLPVGHLPATKTGSTTAPGGQADDDDGDDIDPELLAAAQARLGHMTSDAQQEDVPEFHAADVFKEGGPEGLGELGSEPPCDLVLFKLGCEGDFSLACSCPLSPHSLLTSQTGLPGLDGSAALLGVTDDVDCALLRVGIGPASSSERIEIKHEATVPALAYIAAGKQQKKYLLLPPGSDLASADCVASAVLVESQKYVYVYGVTAPNDTNGRQQVVDLQSAECGHVQSPVEGARLVPAGGRQYVIVLTEHELLLLPLAAPRSR